jgi:hypothetical protein
VPFAENIPFWNVPAVRSFFENVVGLDPAGWVPGEKNVLFALQLKEGGSVRFGVPICFEDVFPDLCRDFFRSGADLLINITNDSWSKTVAGETQHFVAARYRAVEHKRYLVRSTNAGVTAVIGPDGRVEKSLPCMRRVPVGRGEGGGQEETHRVHGTRGLSPPHLRGPYPPAPHTRGEEEGVNEVSKRLGELLPVLIQVYREGVRGGGEGRLSEAEQRTIAMNIRTLSRGLTRERELVGTSYLEDPGLLGAYLLYFWPVSYAQNSSVLSSLRLPVQRALDLGGGPGPSAMALFDAGAKEVVSCDQTQKALRVAQSIAKRLSGRSSPFPGRLESPSTRESSTVSSSPTS